MAVVRMQTNTDKLVISGKIQKYTAEYAWIFLYGQLIEAIDIIVMEANSSFPDSSWPGVVLL